MSQRISLSRMVICIAMIFLLIFLIGCDKSSPDPEEENPFNISGNESDDTPQEDPNIDDVFGENPDINPPIIPN